MNLEDLDTLEGWAEALGNFAAFGPEGPLTEAASDLADAIDDFLALGEGASE